MISHHQNEKPGCFCAEVVMRASFAARNITVLIGLGLCVDFTYAQDAGIVSTTTSSESGDYCRWISFTSDDETPAPRYGHSIVIYKKKIVLFGGYDGSFSNTYMNDMWLWDFSAYAEARIGGDDMQAGSQARAARGTTIGENFDRSKWRVVKVTGQHQPSGRYNHVAAVIENKMLVFAGNSGGSDLLNDLWSFNLDALLWEVHFRPTGADWPGPRSGAKGASIGQSVFIFGGWSSTESALSELWELQSNIELCISGADCDVVSRDTTIRPTWKLLQPTLPAGVGPLPRHGHSTIRVNVDLMVFGGYSSKENSGIYLDDLWRYDVAANAWDSIVVDADMDEKPIPRMDGVAVPMLGGMLLWSGYTSDINAASTAIGTSGHLDDTWLFSNPAGTAIETTSTSITTLTQRIELSETTSVIETRNPTWQRYPSVDASEPAPVEWDGSNRTRPVARRAAGAVPLDMLKGMVVYGGMSKDGLLNDLWLLECGLVDNSWIWWVVLGAVVFLFLVELLRRAILRSRRQRKALTKVTDLLKGLAAKGTGITKEKIAPLGQPCPMDWTPSGRLTPPAFRNYDMSLLKLSENFNKPSDEAKSRWAKLSGGFKAITAFGGLRAFARKAKSDSS